MKKFIAPTLLVSILCFVLIGCGSSNTEDVEISSETIIAALSSVSNMSDNIIYNEDTDPNGNLGRPKQYIGKGDFADSRCEQYGEDLTGGTFEYFTSQSDCKSRYEYLEKFDDPEMGALGLNQYMYMYDTVILRVDYDLKPSEAEEYRDALSSYLGKEPSKQNY